MNISNKILIIGCVGCGKSTYAKRLSKKLSIPVYGIDEILGKIKADNRVETTQLSASGDIISQNKEKVKLLDTKKTIAIILPL